MVVRRSADTCAWMGVPCSVYSASPTSRSIATMPPILARDSRSAARATSSATSRSRSSSFGKICQKRLRPSCASALRSSGWNTTIRAKTP